jgi:hypothetical protein
MITILSALIASLALIFLAPAQTQGELEIVLEQAGNRRVEYVETFKDLTAVETKITELFGRNTHVEKQRKVVSDFLVYQSQIQNDEPREYRLPREVDGKSVGMQSENAVKLFEKLAKANSLREQFEAFRAQTLKYTLRYYRWGIMLQPVPQIQHARQSSYKFEILGRENMAGREVSLLSYRQKESRAAASRGTLAKFKRPLVGNRGRIWLDEDFRICRWENETLVTDEEITSEAVLLRDTIEYESSPFGILIPKRIVTSFFDKPGTKDSQQLHLAGRITYTYSDFKRFEVKTDYEIGGPK